MLIAIGTINLVSIDEVQLPDYGQRQIDVMTTVEMEKVLIDKGGSRIGMPFTLSGLVKTSDLTNLEALTTAVIGSAALQTITITSGAVTVWTGTGYVTRVGGVTLLAGKVLYSGVGGFVAGDTLARVAVEMMFKA